MLPQLLFAVRVLLCCVNLQEENVDWQKDALLGESKVKMYYVHVNPVYDN